MKPTLKRLSISSERELKRLLGHAYRPLPRVKKGRRRSLQFQTIRHGGSGNRGHQSGAAFTITFPEPRQGPFAVGYDAHFGLGLFVAVAPSTNAQ